MHLSIVPSCVNEPEDFVQSTPILVTKSVDNNATTKILVLRMNSGLKKDIRKWWKKNCIIQFPDEYAEKLTEIIDYE
ncbi:13560_t:CDS:2 [Acaulospora morrowiae]|uniref:13560_t:CDS:1 n=1 Tax=Acaulospora morrowiae TaxID=94023 RepID=A0A9N9E2N4_9GLOM|nr:13560_t:CDS:2 [Acaulospora morrowiae]